MRSKVYGGERHLNIKLFASTIILYSWDCFLIGFLFDVQNNKNYLKSKILLSFKNMITQQK
jgi:hypothetical protein